MTITKHVPKRLNLALTCTLLGAFLAPAVQAQHHHEGDIVVGRTATGQLQAHGHFGEAHYLPPVDGLIQGWAGGDPGFDHLHDAEPDEDMYPLEPGAEIRFEVVSFDDAFKAWQAGSGPYLNPGDQVLLGDQHLHTHLDWHIDSSDAAFDPGQSQWQAMFKLVDTGSTGYAASDVITMTFTNVPEPSSLVLLGCALLLPIQARTRSGRS